jgi:hypothetical protein
MFFYLFPHNVRLVVPHLVYVLKSFKEIASFNLGRYNSLDCFMAAKIILSNLLLITFRSERSHIIGVISWIPISVAFSKTIQAVIHFVGQQLYASDFDLGFFERKNFWCYQSQSNFCFE